MRVQKTVQRRAVTIEHGDFEVRETVHACKAGCHTASGAVLARRAGCLSTCLPPRGTFGYDVVVHVGLERFVRHRQREEIRDALKALHGIVVSAGEVSRLALQFLGCLEALHAQRAGALREALAADGGWPLHVDATGEDGRGTLLVAWSGWRSWVLGAWKIPTEREDSVLPCLRAVVARFGEPCAVMRDLGRAMIPATDKLVAGMLRPARVLACHLHFLKDVGNDLLDAAHGALRERFRCSKVRPTLRALARELGRKLGQGIGAGRQALRAWQLDPTPSHRVPEGAHGLAVVRGLAQWTLDYQADSVYRSFPFDRPYLDLYDRCHRVRRAADAFLRRPPQDRGVGRLLERLRRTLDAILTDEQAPGLATTLRTRAVLFDELRATLRLRPDGAAVPSPRMVLSAEEASAQLRDIRADLERFAARLREQRPARGPAQDERQAIDVVIDHLARHGDNLWGHAITLPTEAGGGIRLVDRTNNAQENFFRHMKHGERRRSGRKILTQDFERLPPQAALAANLARSDYVAILCGSLDGLPAAFAQLDADRCRTARSDGTPPPAVTGESDDDALASASLPTADRRIVRSEAMDRRIDRAARSRAPKTKRRAG